MNMISTLLKPLLIVLAISVLVAAPLAVSPFVLSMIVTCLMYVGLTTSWAMFSGPSGYMSLATYAFFGLGVYAAAVTADLLPWPLVVIVGGLAATLFSLIIGTFILNLRGAYFAVLTFGLGQVVMLVVTLAEKTFAGSIGRVMTTIPSEQVSYWTILAVAILSAATYVIVKNTRLGLALRTIGMDEVRSATFGVRPMLTKLAGFGLSAWMAGLMGAAIASRWTYIEPLSAFNPFIVFQTVLIVMVGGASKLYGPVLASVMFSLLSEAMRLSMPNAYMIILGAILIVSALYLPGGMAGVEFGQLFTKRNKEIKS